MSKMTGVSGREPSAKVGKKGGKKKWSVMVLWEVSKFETANLIPVEPFLSFCE